MTLLRSSLFALALVLVTPPYAVLTLFTFPLAPLTRNRIISGWSHLVVWLARVLCGIRWRVEGLQHLPQRPAVILAKHQSAWETMAFQIIFPPQVYLLKRELLWLPFFGWGLALTSPIAIDRSRGTAALRRLVRLGKERLERGFWVVVFPEGTRIPPGSGAGTSRAERCSPSTAARRSCRSRITPGWYGRATPFSSGRE